MVFCPTGTTHLYACEAGYNMNGSAFTTCLESKLWYPSLGNCEPEPWSEYSENILAYFLS